MKWLKLFFLFFIFVGCEKIGFYEYNVKNETEYEISIEGFDRIDMYENPINNYKDFPEVIKILPNSTYSSIKQMGFHSEPPGIFNTIDNDSVNIVFENNRILVYDCNAGSLFFCEIEHNIMGYETDYERVKIGRNSEKIDYRFTYTITEEDYNRAIPIEN